MEISDTDLTVHIENYFQSQRAIVDQAIEAVEVDRPHRLRLVQTLIHNAYREGMQFAMGAVLGARGITKGGTDADDS